MAAPVWLESENKFVTLCVMAVSSSKQHVHTYDPVFEHAASFNVRVGGKATNALAETGATVSCITESFAISVGAHIDRAARQSLEGIGGNLTL